MLSHHSSARPTCARLFSYPIRTPVCDVIRVIRGISRLWHILVFVARIEDRGGIRILGWWKESICVSKFWIVQLENDLLSLYWKYFFFLKISRDKRGINDRVFDDSSTSLFVPSHEILACVRSLLREGGGGDGFLSIAKSAPGTGCWLCNMNADRGGGVRKTVCAARREKRTERGVRSSLRGWLLSSLYHITIPNVSRGLCETFLSFFFFIFYYLRYTRLYMYYTARCKSNIFQLENIALFTIQFIFASEKKVTKVNLETK